MGESQSISHRIHDEQLKFLPAFVITKTFTNLKSLMGDGETFWLFSGLTVLGTIFVFFVVPETKGKSLNEIQKMLEGDKETVDNSEEKN